MLKRIVSVGVVTAGLLALMTPAAHAETPWQDYVLGPGGVLWANLSENPDGGGYQIWVFGTSQCTTTYADREYPANMPPGFDDAVSRVYDWANCDVKLFLNRGALPGDTQTGWIHGGDDGVYVGPNWENKASSYLIS